MELSVHGDNISSGARLGKSNPSEDVATEPEISIASSPCVEACFQLEEKEDNGWVDDKVVGLPPEYGQLHKLSNVNSKFNACKLFDKRSQIEGLFSERMLADAVVDWLLSKILTSLSINFQNWYPMLVGLLRDMIGCCNEPYITAFNFNYLLNDKRKWEEWYPDDKTEKLTKNVELMFEEFKSAILDCSYNILFVTFGCLYKDQLHKLSNAKPEFNALQLFDKRLQLEGLYSEERLGDAIFGWLHKSVLVRTGDMNSMDLLLEVFPSLPYIYQNWRAVLIWFLAAMIQCSIDPYVFIDNILLADIGGRVSLYLHLARIELKLEKAFKEMLIKSYESKLISSTVTSDGLAHEWVHSLCRTGFQFTISFKLALIDLLRFGFIDKNMRVLAFLVNHKPIFLVDVWKINRVLGCEDQVEIVVKVYESYEHCELLMQVDLHSRVSSLVNYTKRRLPMNSALTVCPCMF